MNKSFFSNLGKDFVNDNKKHLNRRRRNSVYTEEDYQKEERNDQSFSPKILSRSRETRNQMKEHYINIKHLKRRIQNIGNVNY